MLSQLALNFASLVSRGSSFYRRGAPPDAEMAETWAKHETPSGAFERSLSSPAPLSSSPPPTPLPPELPSEIWGEVARFSARDDILNLRATCKTTKVEAETAIPIVTLNGQAQVNAFIAANGFKHLHTLHAIDLDNAGLCNLATHLQAHPRHDLTLELENSHRGLSLGLDRLHAVPLSMLRLHNVFLIDRVVAALANCPFPIELSGYFCQEEFVSATCIPTLRKLTSPSTEFADATARYFSRHTALQALSLRASENLTTRGIADLAKVPELRSLSLDETCVVAAPIDTATANALADHLTLQHLSIPSSAQPLSETCVSILSHSTTLRSLEISVCHGLLHLANMVSLEHLRLNGGRGGPAINANVARVVANLPNLRSLCLDATSFEPKAFTALLKTSHASELSLERLALRDEDVAALMGNGYVRTLSLEFSCISRDGLLTLLKHPAMKRVTVDGQHYAVTPIGAGASHDALAVAPDRRTHGPLAWPHSE